MSKNLSFVSCPDEISDNFIKIAKSYRYNFQKLQNYNDFISAIKNHEIDTDIVILYIDENISDQVQFDKDALEAISDNYAFILIYDKSIIQPSDEICNAADYEIDVCELSVPATLKKILARSARIALIRKLHNYSRIKDKNQHLIESFVGRSDLAKNVRDTINKLVNVPISSVFIIGETGTGKGLAARILHSQSVYISGPLIEVNCSAIPAELLESELFGHEAGAFTGAKKSHRGYMEQANGGTLFLDEITEMDLDLQSKLLKAIEDKVIRRVGGENEIEVSLTIIAASNKDLTKVAEDKSLREDLYHRLGVFCLELPPLRKRKEDMLDLVPRIIHEYNYKSGKKVSSVKDATWKKLMDYDWPGNIRELRNVIERCVLFSDDETFDDQWMIGDQCNNMNSQTFNSAKDDLILSDILEEEQQQQTIDRNIEEEQSEYPVCKFPINGSISISDMEKEIIKTALETMGGNVTETARLLRMSREKLRYRISKYKLTT